MYNRYIPGSASYAPIPEEEAPPAAPRPEGRRAKGAAGGLTALLKGLGAEGMDTGDVLLLLIVLLLALEGDDWETVLILGLLLLLGPD